MTVLDCLDEPRTLSHPDSKVVPSPLVEQQQEEGQRHHPAGTLDPLIHRVQQNPGTDLPSGAEPEEQEGTKRSGFDRKADLAGVVPTAWLLEVGFRAALHTETVARDPRWWNGLDWKGTSKNG